MSELIIALGEFIGLLLLSIFAIFTIMVVKKWVTNIEMDPTVEQTDISDYNS